MYLKLNFGRYTENPLLILEKENNKNSFFFKNAFSGVSFWYESGQHCKKKNIE